MKFIDLSGLGGPDVMFVSQGAQPQPSAGEVLIRVHAAGINRPDIIQRKGHYPAPPGSSPILGLEVAGEVVACGAGASTWTPGDMVCALTNGGGYAEYVVVPEGQCLPIPKGFSMVEAAAIPETFFTVWSNVFDRAGLAPGETLLVHGAAGGIGTTAIQLGKAMGAKVFVTAGSDKKCRVCETLGADRAINYHTEDFVAVLKSESESGADVILDIVGGDYIQRNIDCAANDGRIVNIAYLQGAKAEVNFMRVMLKRLILTGSTLRSQSTGVKMTIANHLHEHVWPLLAQGQCRPLIDQVFDLEGVVEAHQRMEANDVIGKVVLQLVKD